MSITIRLLDSVPTIQTNVNTAIATFINDRLSSNLNTILRRTRDSIRLIVRRSPEIRSLENVDPLSLAGQFGFNISLTSITSAIINSIVDSTSVRLVPYTNSLRGGGLTITCQPVTFTNLLGLPQGHTVYMGGDLHWLNWLLTQGDSIIVVNYSYNPKTGLGRSGLGNMIPGGSFRVPPQYSGDIGNNFVTRALANPELEQLLTKIVRDTLNG